MSASVRRIREWLERPITRRVLALAVLIAAIVCAAQVHRRASRPIGNDLTSYLLSASALWAGEDPYATRTVFPYVYPLFLAFVLSPIGLLPPLLAQALWLAVGIGALWLVQRRLVPIAFREMAWARPRHLGGTLCLLGLWLLDPIQINLVNGQVNFVVLALLALFLERHLSGRWIAAGALLGAAVAIKLVPAVLFACLAARQAWKTLALAAASAAVFCVVPYVCTGDRLWRYYERYLHSFVLARAQGPGVPGREIVFSLAGTARGFFPDAPVLALHASAIALVLAPAVALAYRRRGPGAALWAFGLFLLAIPLLTPMSEVHHLAVLFPAAAWTTLASLYRLAPADRLGAGLVAAGWLFFWVGRLDRLGPWYLVSLVVFYLATLREGLRAPAQRPNA